MTRETAIKRLQRLLGARMYWRVATGVSSPEKRAAYAARRAAAKTAWEAAQAALTARREAVLAADAEYQRLYAEWRAARDAKEDVRYHDGESGYKFEVGTRDGIFVTPKAYGDTWEQVFEKLDAQSQIGGAR